MSFTAYGEYLINAYNQGVSIPQLRHMARAFLDGYTREIDRIYHTDYTTTPSLEFNPAWTGTLQRIGHVHRHLVPLIRDGITHLNRGLLMFQTVHGPHTNIPLHLPNPYEQMQQVAFELLSSLNTAGDIMPPPGFSSLDITIERTSRLNVLDIRENQRWWCEVTIPTADGTKESYYIQSDWSEAQHHRHEQMLEILQPLTEGRYNGYNSWFVTYKNIGFRISTKMPERYTLDIEQFLHDLDKFARQWGIAVAEATIVGLTGPSNFPFNDMLVSNTILDVNTPSSANFTPQELFEQWTTVFSELIRAERNIYSNPREIAMTFIDSYARTIDRIYQIYSKDTADIQNNPLWQETSKRISTARERFAIWMNSGIASLNNTFSLELPNPHNRLQQITYSVFKNLDNHGMLSVPQNFAPHDIAIVRISRLDNLTMIEYQRWWCEVRIPLADGTFKTFILKTHSSDNNSLITTRLLNSLGRQQSGHYFVEADGIDIVEGCHVFEEVGTMGADEYIDTIPDSEPERLEEFAYLLGKTFGEAYMIGLPDRKLGNMRVVLHNGFPVSVVNIDLDRSLESPLSISGLIGFTFMTPLMKKQIGARAFHRIAVTFSRGFYETVEQIQDYYRAHESDILNQPALAEHPNWDECIDRISTPPAQIAHSLAALFNNTWAPVLMNMTIAPDEILPPPPGVVDIDREKSALREIGLQIAHELADADKLSLPENITATDIVVQAGHAGTIFQSDQPLQFELAIPCADGTKKWFHIKSAQENDRESATYAALSALHRLRHLYHYSLQSYQNRTGCHVIEIPRGSSFTAYRPHHANAVQYAYMAGRALGESILLFGAESISPHALCAVLDESGKKVNDIVDLNALYGKSTRDRKAPRERCADILRHILYIPMTEQLDEQTVIACRDSFIHGIEEVQGDIKTAVAAHRSRTGTSPSWARILLLDSDEIDGRLGASDELKAFLTEKSATPALTTIRELKQLSVGILRSLGRLQNMPALSEIQASDVTILTSSVRQFLEISEPDQIALEVQAQTGDHSEIYRIYASTESPWVMLAEHQEKMIHDILSTLRDTSIQNDSPLWPLVAQDPNSVILDMLAPLSGHDTIHTGEIVSYQWNQYRVFHVVDKIGDIDAAAFNSYSPQITAIAHLWGQTAAEMNVAGLYDSDGRGFRVVVHDDTVEDVVAIPSVFTYSVEPEEVRFLQVVKGFSRLLSNAQEADVSTDRMQEIAQAFIEGYREGIQTLYHELMLTDKEYQIPAPGENFFWDTMVQRITRSTDRLPAWMQSGITYLNEEFELDVKPPAAIDHERHNDMSATEIQVAAYQPEKAALADLAFRIITELSESGRISIPEGITVSDINIGLWHIGSEADTPADDAIWDAQLILTGLTMDAPDSLPSKLWFTFSIPGLEGARTGYHVKSVEQNDYTDLGILALEAVGRKTYAYYRSTETHLSHDTFHVTEIIGDIDLESAPVESFGQALSMAGYIGDALAEAFMLGIADRHSNNLRVAFYGHNQISIHNVDLQTALGPDESEAGNSIRAFGSFLIRQQRSFTQDQVNAMAQQFINRFRVTLQDMQQYYAAHSDELEMFPGLADNPRWHDALRRMDASRYDISALMIRIADYINATFSVSVRDGAPLVIAPSAMIAAETERSVRATAPTTHNEDAFVQQRNTAIEQFVGTFYSGQEALQTFLLNLYDTCCAHNASEAAQSLTGTEIDRTVLSMWDAAQDTELAGGVLHLTMELMRYTRGTEFNSGVFAIAAFTYITALPPINPPARPSSIEHNRSLVENSL